MASQDYEVYRPPAHPVPEAPRTPAPRRHHPVGFCGGGPATHHWMKVVTICVVIWAATGGGYFWPMWVMIGLGIPILLGRR
ncbi:2TM domain-containing protein [Nocardioides panacisoli]|uniref:2TM domain-containing protein n=1 Tax=Nocardioides panacisoli TaxID=627624 RepID=UPI001C62584B|nr:2TM domain-containing protein [Nocardioides panacisoli]QYJ03442.1 2TM domain-containing protein [Nocardioides panacisoli]